MGRVVKREARAGMHTRQQRSSPSGMRQRQHHADVAATRCSRAQTLIVDAHDDAMLMLPNACYDCDHYCTNVCKTQPRVLTATSHLTPCSAIPSSVLSMCLWLWLWLWLWYWSWQQRSLDLYSPCMPYEHHAMFQHHVQQQYIMLHASSDMVSSGITSRIDSPAHGFLRAAGAAAPFVAAAFLSVDTCKE